MTAAIASAMVASNWDSGDWTMIAMKVHPPLFLFLSSFFTFPQPAPFSFFMFFFIISETLDFRNFAQIGNFGRKFFYFSQNALKSKTKTFRGYFTSDSCSKRKFSSVSYKTKQDWQLWSLATPCLANETIKGGKIESILLMPFSISVWCFFSNLKWIL